jgi:hypothetical protein
LNITKILLKVALNTITPSPSFKAGLTEDETKKCLILIYEKLTSGSLHM